MPQHPKHQLIEEMIDLYDSMLKISIRLKQEGIPDKASEMRSAADALLIWIDDIGEKYARKES